MGNDINSFSDLKDYLREDLKANDGSKRVCAFKYLKWLRISRYCEQKAKNNCLFRILSYVARGFRRHYANKYGFDFKATVPLGKGYTISHNTGVIFMVKSAGDFLIFRNFVVVGESYAGSGCPTIGSFVTFGAGCKVLGPIFIGNNVVIGANAVVTHDVPDHSVVAGVPARVIRKTKDRWGTPLD